MNPFYEKKFEKPHINQIQNLNFPAHLHDAVEIIFVINGRIQVTIQDVTLEMSEGELAIVFPETVHAYRTEPSKESTAILFIFDENMFGPFLNQLKRSHPTNPYLKSYQVHSDILYALNRLEASSNEDASGFLLGAWIQVILAHVLPLLSLQKNARPDNTDLTYRLVWYISQHFQEPMSLDTLAKELNVSKYYLSHVFSKKLKMGFHEYLNNIRLDYAQYLTRSTNDTFTKIWSDAGFESQRTFNRVFKEKYGVSPKDYRLK